MNGVDNKENKDNDDCLIFLHIPKAAGTTFAQILQQRYPGGSLEWLGSEGAMSADEAFEALSSTRKAEVGAVMGHINFGGHRLLPKPARYVTFMRHPVDRIVSHYYHVLRNPQHYLHDEVRSKKMDLAAYAASDLSLELENDQTRMIAGNGVYESDAEMLETAYRNIDQHFACIGVTERFAESVLLISHLRGWSIPYYQDVNIGANKPRNSAVSDEVIAIIEGRNHCDMELYRYAQTRLTEQLDASMPDWKTQTERFLWRNHQYARVAQAKNLIRRGVGASIRLLKGGMHTQSALQPQSTMNTLL
ncbi:hypothetical protein CCAX7_24470 [Capsulimonas corticalis]|uniref:Uncharacterized protein n=1 Tax=Capsulimonas corticalis TaxID=2219043 RepID=A0A402CVE3_9BACT|nr:sulfotransferase family 2 domain-containing protein [Capsulimonas corticalis]BDI30396.1 hypothetical protein CCAX7_24470 [Capsulimonas corticalis]